MCLSGFRGTSIPVKQDLRELSPERGFKMNLEFYDTFRGVGPIKFFFAVYKTSKFINMYSGCFEWKRTGSVTGESTQSWLVKFLHNLQFHKYVFRLFWMEEGLWRWRVRKVDLDKFLRNLQILTKPPKSYICIPVVLNGRELGLWRWRVRKVDLAKFYEEI